MDLLLMSPITAALLGVVEGITEFLPVSSTAHLIMAGVLWHVPQTEALKTFDIAIQSGAILAVLLLYGKRLLVSKDVLLKTLIAFIPTGLIGLALHKFIKAYLFGDYSIIASALLIGGIVLILVDLLNKDERATVQQIEAITYTQAIILGFVQAIAIIPGVSRSGATIVGGLLMGIKRTVIVEFTFLLAIPTLLAATGYDLLKSASAFSGADFVLLGIGFATSFVVAILSIRWLLAFVQKRSFAWFGIYRILVGLIFFAAVLMEGFRG